MRTALNPISAFEANNEVGFLLPALSLTAPLLREFLLKLSLNELGSYFLNPNVGNNILNKIGEIIMNILMKKGTYELAEGCESMTLEDRKALYVLVDHWENINTRFMKLNGFSFETIYVSFFLLKVANETMNPNDFQILFTLQMYAIRYRDLWTEDYEDQELIDELTFALGGLSFLVSKYFEEACFDPDEPLFEYDFDNED
ncbi:hypothetical protein ACMXYX_04940 [Neptuniibacter sp. QD72_48]|uniref:hypothetical protein n=1 Tax=Neptuniibacter sp. QD72_48 TaxID=3398214 RepID=UPI0039F528FE